MCCDSESTPGGSVTSQIDCTALIAVLKADDCHK